MSTFQYRNVCFTLNNPTDDELRLESHFNESGKVQYAVWQLERGANGTEHIQGYLELKGRLRLTPLRTLLFGRAHIESRRGTQQQAIDYCQKAETRVAGPYRFGEPKEQGKRRDIDDTMDSILGGSTFDDLLEAGDGNAIRFSRGCQLAVARVQQRVRQVYRRQLQVYVLWGAPGTGKTRHAYEQYGFDNVYPLVTSPSKSVWFDGYEGQKILLIDDYRGFIAFNFFLKMLDIYPLRLDVKGSFTHAAWEKVYITSNHSPDLWYNPDSDHCLRALKRRFTSIYHYCSNGDIWRSDHTEGGAFGEERLVSGVEELSNADPPDVDTVVVME